MKTLYLDIFSGISGDMFIAALIDLGVSEHQIKYKVAELGLDGYKIEVERKEKSGIAGVKFDVILEGAAHHGHAHSHLQHEALHEHTPAPRRKSKAGASPILNATFTKYNPAKLKLQEARREYAAEHAHEHERNFLDICDLINNAKLSPWVKEKSVAVFHRIAIAEGKIHGKPPGEVHFHEVGAVDSIVDIVGACIALEILGRPRVLAGNVQEGTGWLQCAHGRFPIPAPATMGILSARGVPITQTDEPHELVTPTGAALLAEFVESFGPMQGIAVEKIGFGLGTRNNLTRPNVLRVVLGESVEQTTSIAQPAVTMIPTKASAESQPTSAVAAASTSTLDWETDTIAVLETNLDDINAELLGGFVETALAAGALDVFHTPIQMKKNRPGVLLTVLCAEAEADRFTELLLRETTAFGVRRTLAERRKLPREFVSVATEHGAITAKLGRLNGEVVQAAPEFESCRQVAAASGVSLKRVYDAALKALEAAGLR